MIQATVTSHIKFTGDQESEIIFNSGPLANSAAVQQLATALAGVTVFSAPVVDGFVVHGVVIVPPSANAAEMTLMGAPGDVGILISASQPSVIHFGADPTSFALVTIEDVIGLRLVWF